MIQVNYRSYYYYSCTLSERQEENYKKGGFYETEDLALYVGTGIGNSVIPVRVFNPPEILTIILE